MKGKRKAVNWKAAPKHMLRKIVEERLLEEKVTHGSTSLEWSARKLNSRSGFLGRVLKDQGTVTPEAVVAFARKHANEESSLGTRSRFALALHGARTNLRGQRPQAAHDELQTMSEFFKRWQALSDEAWAYLKSRL